MKLTMQKSGIPKNKSLCWVFATSSQIYFEMTDYFDLRNIAIVYVHAIFTLRTYRHVQISQ